MLRTTWRWFFPRLQRFLPSHHGNPLLARVDRLATVFHGLYENGNYDPASNGEAWLLQQLACFRPALILDVGANRGEYSRLALDICPQARVIAFEPIPSVFAQLEAALGQEPRAELHNAALADSNGEIRFLFDPARTGNTSAVVGVQTAIHGLTAPEQITASALRLDHFCDSNGVNHIDLLKIDVEGFESQVMAGGVRCCSMSRLTAFKSNTARPICSPVILFMTTCVIMVVIS
ncbi:FkbM family methyltransferase [Synechococcus sp. CCY9201]|uniref:FkbM family methyltransferase n=1 Tax=Synechococcus sp. CCY9201 TaxID=174697 RepID=UPI002B1EC6EA|nr:FkbM family methyltransferase [Synechococcus sp. CCY9201]MEA5474681.1 FkbM family methyltransferase [Synechococcus sp. CCY9201]